MSEFPEATASSPEDSFVTRPPCLGYPSKDFVPSESIP